MGALPREEKRASLEGSLMRAVEGNLGHPYQYRGGEIEGRGRRRGLMTRTLGWTDLILKK
jgi:hypothetical protein